MSQFTLGRDSDIRPLPIVEELLLLCPLGVRVLDIGAGTGRNSLFLARHGFSVDAIDRSPLVVGELLACAESHDLPVRAWVHDLCKDEPEFRGYEVILCTLTLHYLTSPRANSLLSNARTQATPGTLHVLGAITLEGDFYRELSLRDRYYPTADDLQASYAEAGWEIHRSYKENREMLESHPDGTPMRNVVSFLIARKPYLP